MVRSVYHPDDQTITDSPERKSRRRARRWCAIADTYGRIGKYAAVSLLTLLVAVPNARLAVFVMAANLLLLGIAIGSAMRWRAS
ncbi:hypothetical protein DRQ53_15130 [bacterium]|nr:MAG: hypothetical protein DRQ53_15130 [bacterium]